MQTLKGTVRGRTIELEKEPCLTEGTPVNVIIVPVASPPCDSEALEALKRSAGGWSDDVEGLDRFLEWNRRQRKIGRGELPG